jgi:hypothetical protein
VSSRSLHPAEEVVGDTKYCDIMIIKVFAELEIEVDGLKHTTLGGEVVQIVDDDDSGLEFVDRFKDVVMHVYVTFIENAEVIKTHEHEIAVVDWGADRALDVINDAATSEDRVNGIYPEYSVGIAIFLSLVLGDLEGRHGCVAAVEDCCRQHLGEGMSPAVGSACQEGNLVLMENG